MFTLRKNMLVFSKWTRYFTIVTVHGLQSIRHTPCAVFRTRRVRDTKKRRAAACEKYDIFRPVNTYSQ